MKVPPLGPHWTKRLKGRGAPTDLESCRRDGTTVGYDNAYDRVDGIQAAIWWNRFRRIIDPRFYPVLHESPKGNPRTWPIRVTDFGGTIQVTCASIEFAAMAGKVVPLIETEGLFRILEIGGGYGGLARAILETCRQIESYTIVDIPEVARVAAWFLADYPKVRVILPDELAAVPLPTLVIQTRGFAEMSAAELAYYFAFINRLRPGAMLWTINRLTKVSALRDYPFDSRWKVGRMSGWGGLNMKELLAIRTKAPQPCGVREAIRKV